MGCYKNPFESAVTGLEAKDWIRHNMTVNTTYTDLAKRMTKFFNLEDNKIYMFKLCDNVPIAKEVKQRGVKYKIPCNN